jgi:hypothetical protein
VADEGTQDEATQRLIAQARIQHAQEEAKRARANLPLGLLLVAIGVGIATACILLMPSLGVAKVLGVGIGFVFIPGGVAVVARSMATIVSANRTLRAERIPPARALE